MTREQVYSTWAPPAADWSEWVKPVLFAHLQRGMPSTQDLPPEPEASWAPPADGRSAIVVDLPGSAGVWMGLALAALGYRPVPLYNAAPGPGEILSDTSIAAVDVWPIIAALLAATSKLRELPLAPDAPPAFLLDANRRTGRGVVLPGQFDNRSITFPTDFPSANFLLNRGIASAVLLQEFDNPPAPDLAHTLRRWQDGRIAISFKPLNIPGAPQPIVVTRPSMYRWIWHRMLTLAGLRRNPLGGFGGTLPEPSSG